MILDKQLLLADAQAVTATADAANVIDSSVARNLGVGGDLWIFALCTETMSDSGSDSTVTVSVVTDDNESLSSDSTILSMFTFAALSTAGTMYFGLIPAERATAYERYIGAVFTVANGNLTTGKFTVGLTKDIQYWKSYANNYAA